MGNIATVGFRLLIIAAQAAVISAAVLALVLFLTIVGSALTIGLNFGVVNDIVGLMQLWSPFNIGVVLLWIITAASAFMIYKLSMLAVTFLRAWLSN